MTSVTDDYRGPSISSEDLTGVGSRSTRRTDTDNLPTGQQWNTGKELAGNDDNAPTLSAAVDWYPDPYYPNANILRYYDGRQWTRHTAQQPAQAQTVVSSPPQPYYPQVAAPQYVPLPPRRSTNALWAVASLLVIAVFVVFVAVMVTVASSVPRIQDDKAYQYGYSQVGPSSVSAVKAGYSPSSACYDGTVAEQQIGFYDFGGQQPAWWDSDKIQQGCVAYLNATDSYGQYLHH